jgi:hypothetical protein
MRKSLQASLTAIFAALHSVLYFVSFGLWRNWGIYLEPVEAVVLGPRIGFLAALVGSLVARIARPDALWMFGLIAEPVSVLIAGLLARARWKPVLIAYAVMLSAYFLHPFGRALPLWTILDILLALLLIYPAARLSRALFGKDVKSLSIALVAVSFVCIATDSLVRVFLLVPCGLYGVLFPSYEVLYAVFVVGAASSYVEDVIVVLVSFVAGVPLVMIASKLGILEKNNKKGEKAL